MDKRQYKRVMEQIQMSDACEQRILDAVHRQEMPKRKKLRGPQDSGAFFMEKTPDSSCIRAEYRIFSAKFLLRQAFKTVSGIAVRDAL